MIGFSFGRDWLRSQHLRIDWYHSLREFYDAMILHTVLTHSFIIFIIETLFNVSVHC